MDMRLAMVFAAALAGLTVTADLAQAQRGGRNAPTITLYDQPNYQGQSVTIDTDTSSLRWVDFNDRTSSYRVSGGQWEVCAHADYRGSCMVVDSDNPNLTPSAFNNQMSSVRPVHDVNRRGRVRDNGITLWSGPNFTGRSITLVDSESSLRRLNFNDAARSVEVHSGEWTVCRDSDFEGRCTTISRDIRNLSQVNMDRAISSVSDRPRNGYDGGYGGGRPGYGDRPPYGGGRGRIDGGVRGVDSVFFPQPTFRGYPIARCLGAGGGCGQQTAREICESAGYSRAAHFASRPSSQALWFLYEQDVRRANAQIVDVLCIR